ncbi:hypothetical protein [Sessilibacter corallicola]|uniref:Uncharacterized protein n=1 Tax=Sessilibacter corallicola TaxID=2904075 RepID=A0ABQ0ACV9_9GAMM
MIKNEGIKIRDRIEDIEDKYAVIDLKQERNAFSKTLTTSQETSFYTGRRMYLGKRQCIL